MKELRKAPSATRLTQDFRAPSDFGIVGHPKDGDAMQVHIPGQALAEGMGQSAHPAMAGATGQVINMAFNTPSPHLTFKEWMARGVVGGIGKVLAFPFAFAGNMITAAGNAVIGLVKMAILIVLVPTLLWLGVMLYQKVSKAQSIEEGTAMIVTDAKKVGNGIGNSISSETPATPPRPQN